MNLPKEPSPSLRWDRDRIRDREVGEGLRDGESPYFDTYGSTQQDGADQALNTIVSCQVGGRDDV